MYKFTENEGNRNSASPDFKKTLQNHTLDVAEKCVRTYFSSNAAAQDPMKGYN